MNDNLREAIARAANDAVAQRNEAREPSLPTPRWDEQSAYVRQMFGEIADAILTLPEMAALLADAERVQRVRALAEEWEGKGESKWQEWRRALTHDYDGALYVRALRHALDGDKP